MPDPGTRYVCGDNRAIDMTNAVRAACGEPRIVVPSIVRGKAAAEAGATMVRLQCHDDHWCDFPCEGAAGTEVVGTPVGKNEVARWTAWQNYADPIEGMKRLDAYSTWVLAANTIVIMLATGLASDKVPPALETSAAKWLFGAAVAALGLSWVFISLVKAPTWKRLNRNSPREYIEAFNQALGTRRPLFAAAASLLGVSLALAALIPLVRSLKQAAPPRVVLGYTWSTDSAYSAELHGEGLPPNTPLEVLVRKDGPAAIILPVQRVRTDANGAATAQVEVPARRQLAPPFRVVARWTTVAGSSTSWSADSVSFPVLDSTSRAAPPKVDSARGGG